MNIRFHMALACALSLAAEKGDAQTWQSSTPQELLERIEANGKLYEAVTSYRLLVDMASYRSTDDVVAFDEAQSTVVKSGKRYRVDALGMVTVQDEQYRVTVDSAERMIMVGRAGDIMDVVGADHARIIIENAASVTKRSQRDGVTFRVVFRKGAYYTQLENTYDTEGWLKKIECYWGVEVKENPDDPKSPGYKPRVVMRFGRPERLKEEVTTRHLDIGQFVAFQGGKPYPVGSWSGYEVFDTRVQ